MKINNELATKLFDISKKDMANFLALFCSLDIDDEFSSNLGKIVKISDTTLKIVLSEKNINKITEELTTDDDDTLPTLFY